MNSIRTINKSINTIITNITPGLIYGMEGDKLKEQEQINHQIESILSSAKAKKVTDTEVDESFPFFLNNTYHKGQAFSNVLFNNKIIPQVKGQLTITQEQSESIKRFLSSLNSQIKEVLNDYKELFSNMQKLPILKQELYKAIEKTNQLQQQLTTLQVEKQELEQNLHILWAEKEELEKKTGVLTVQNQKLQQQLNELLTRLDAIQAATATAAQILPAVVASDEGRMSEPQDGPVANTSVLVVTKDPAEDEDKTGDIDNNKIIKEKLDFITKQIESKQQIIDKLINQQKEELEQQKKTSVLNRLFNKLAAAQRSKQHDMHRMLEIKTLETSLKAEKETNAVTMLNISKELKEDADETPMSEDAIIKEIKELQESVKTLQTSLKDTQGNLTKSQEEVQRVIGEKNEILQKHQQIAEEGGDEKDKEFAKLQLQVSKLSDSLSKETKAKEEAKKELEAAEKQISEKEKALEKITSLETELSETKKELDTTKKQLEAAKKSQIDKETEIDIDQKPVLSNKETLELQTKITELEKELQEEKDKSKPVTETPDLSDENSRLQAEITDLQGKLKAANEQPKTTGPTTADTSDLSGENSRLKKENNSLTTQLTTITDQKNKLETEKTVLDNQLANVKSEKDILDKEKTQLTIDNNALSAKNATLQSAVQKLQKELNNEKAKQTTPKTPTSPKDNNKFGYWAAAGVGAILDELIRAAYKSLSKQKKLKDNKSISDTKVKVKDTEQPSTIEASSDI